MNKEKLLADFEAASLIALNKFYKENPDATQKEFLAFIQGWQAAGEYTLTLIPKFLL